jgi:copper chaperone CopZ
MKSRPFVLSIALLSITLTAFAEETRQKSNEREKTVEATYLITGLHCPPCTKTVESSLQNVKGIRSIKVDWDSKQARIEFDEAVLPAQKVAQLIAGTPHMMGRNLHYDGWLALKVSEVASDETAKPVVDVLQKIEGIKRVAAYPKQHSVALQFDTKGQLTSAQLIRALAKAGFHATNL